MLLKSLESLIVAGKNSYGHEHIYIGEDDNGKVMGILVTFRGDEIKYFEEIKIFKQEMEFLNFIKLSLVKPIYDQITASSIQKMIFTLAILLLQKV